MPTTHDSRGSADTAALEIVRAGTGAGTRALEVVGDRQADLRPVDAEAHAAWAVPLVQMAVAVPAGAVPVTVTASLAVVCAWSGSEPEVIEVPSGCTVSQSGASTITLAAGQPLSPSTLATLTPRSTVQPRHGTTSVTVTATATGTTAGPETVAVPYPPR